MKLLKQMTLSTIVAFSLATSVFAAGETTKKEVCTTTYGGATDCKTVEVPQEEIVRVATPHQPVETGFVENAILAVGLMITGYFVMLLAKRYEVIK